MEKFIGNGSSAVPVWKGPTQLRSGVGAGSPGIFQFDAFIASLATIASHPSEDRSSELSMVPPAWL